MSIKWSHELILKCDIKDCKNSRKLSTKVGGLLRSPKQLEEVAKSEGWNLDLYGITVCPDCNKKSLKYIKEKMAEIN